jgi:hypothetical protein
MLTDTTNWSTLTCARHKPNRDGSKLCRPGKKYKKYNQFNNNKLKFCFVSTNESSSEWSARDERNEEPAVSWNIDTGVIVDFAFGERQCWRKDCECRGCICFFGAEIPGLDAVRQMGAEWHLWFRIPASAQIDYRLPECAFQLRLFIGPQW